MAVVTLLSLPGCFRPETMAECQQRSSDSARRDCIDSNIRRDTVGGVATGAAVGAIIGAAAGGIIGRGRGALIGGVGGGLTGGVAGGVITYYVDHREADALEDIFASNRKLEVLAENYREQNSALGQTLQQSSQSAERQREENEREVERLQTTINNLKIGRENYEKAVRLRYQGQIPEEIREQLRNNDMQIASLTHDRDDAYERIRQLDELKYGHTSSPSS